MPFLRFNCSCWILEMRIMRNTFRMITIILRKFSFHLLFIPCNLNHSNCLQNIATLLCTELSFTTTPPLRPSPEPTKPIPKLLVESFPSTYYLQYNHSKSFIKNEFIVIPLFVFLFNFPGFIFQN